MKKEFKITIKVIDYWFDFIKNKVYALMEWCNELHLVEKDLK